MVSIRETKHYFKAAQLKTANSSATHEVRSQTVSSQGENGGHSIAPETISANAASASP